MLDGQLAMFEGCHIQHVVDPADTAYHCHDLQQLLKIFVDEAA